MRLKSRTFYSLALAFSIALAFALSPFASSSPDGLEKVAQVHGFSDKAQADPAWRGAAMPDYSVPRVRNAFLSTGFSGAIGTLLVFAAGYGLARIALRGRTSPSKDIAA